MHLSMPDPPERFAVTVDRVQVPSQDPAGPTPLVLVGLALVSGLVSIASIVMGAPLVALIALGIVVGLGALAVALLASERAYVCTLTATGVVVQAEHVPYGDITHIEANEHGDQHQVVIRYWEKAAPRRMVLAWNLTAEEANWLLAWVELSRARAPRANATSRQDQGKLAAMRQAAGRGTNGP